MGTGGLRRRQGGDRVGDRAGGKSPHVLVQADRIGQAIVQVRLVQETAHQRPRLPVPVRTLGQGLDRLLQRLGVAQRAQREQADALDREGRARLGSGQSLGQVPDQGGLAAAQQRLGRGRHHPGARAGIQPVGASLPERREALPQRSGEEAVRIRTRAGERARPQPQEGLDLARRPDVRAGRARRPRSGHDPSPPSRVPLRAGRASRAWVECRVGRPLSIGPNLHGKDRRGRVDAGGRRPRRWWPARSVRRAGAPTEPPSRAARGGPR